MKQCLFLLVAFATFSISSCIAEEEFDVPVQHTPQNKQNINEFGVYHILVIGNSLSRDAFSYVPAIMKDLCPNITVNMNIYYKGGVGLSSHLYSLTAGRLDHTLDTFDSTENKWKSENYILGQEAIDLMPWDLIILQEGNITSRDYEKTRNNLRDFRKFIQSKNENTKIAFMMVPAQPEGSSALGSYTSDDVWQMFANTSQHLYENQEVEYIIPCGTAIQNARHTRLDELGNYGHLSYDGTHLQEGLPCLIDAYVAAQSIFMIFGIDTNIMDCGLRISKNWVYELDVPGSHGSTILGDETDYKLCQHCALEAIYHPYQIMDTQDKKQ